jgi:hypothetical protein
MSASTQGIGPLSVRYAAQIRELLYTQAVDRMAAEQEAARAAEHAREAERIKPPEEPVKVDIETRKPEPAPVAQAEPAAEPMLAKLVDIQV